MASFVYIIRIKARERFGTKTKFFWKIGKANDVPRRISQLIDSISERLIESEEFIDPVLTIILKRSYTIVLANELEAFNLESILLRETEQYLYPGLGRECRKWICEQTIILIIKAHGYTNILKISDQGNKSLINDFQCNIWRAHSGLDRSNHDYQRNQKERFITAFRHLLWHRLPGSLKHDSFEVNFDSVTIKLVQKLSWEGAFEFRLNPNAAAKEILLVTEEGKGPRGTYVENQALKICLNRASRAIIGHSKSTFYIREAIDAVSSILYKARSLSQPEQSSTLSDDCNSYLTPVISQ